MAVYEDVFGEPERKKGINSKEKGDRNENAAAKFLSKWTGYDFKRVPRSGGIGAEHKLFVGDVVCITEPNDFPFTVETKHYEHVPCSGILRSNSKIYGFWEQALNDSKKVDLLPMLLFRENGMPKEEYVMFVSRPVYTQCIILYNIPYKALGEKRGYWIYGVETWEILEKIPYKEMVELLKSVKWK